MKFTHHRYYPNPLIGLLILIIQVFLVAGMLVLTIINYSENILNILPFVILVLWGILILYLALGEMK